MASEDKCYICLGEETNKEKLMHESPCICKGSIKIHWSCFAEVRKSSEICGICKNRFSFRLFNNNEGFVKITLNYRKDYYKSGIPYAEGPYVNGKGNGHWKVYYESGALKGEGPYENGQQNGHWKVYHESGVLKEEGPCVNGQRHGHWKEYIKVNNYNSHWNRYYESGVLKSSDFIIDGLNRQKEYYESGELQMEGLFKNGQRNGYWTTYYKCGAKLATGLYNEGQATGQWKIYYKSGSIKAEGQFINGQQNGHWREYYESWDLKGEGPCKNGEKIIAEWIHYDDPKLAGKKRPNEDQEQPEAKKARSG